MKPMIKKQTLHELVILPERDPREQTKEFNATKKRLRADGHYSCFICGTTTDLEVHHFGCENSLRDICDFEKLKIFSEKFDIYGYGKLLTNTPITSVDDIRNCMVLCREHHLSSDSDGVANGIHNITFPVWIIQRLQKDGENIVPSNTEELNEEMKEFNDGKQTS